MNMEAELQRALLPKDTRICPHPEQFSPLSVKILETPSGSSPTPQFLTFLAAPSAAQLSPRRTSCHQLSPFFHPVSSGARKPSFGGRRAVASTPFATAKSQLGDTSPWAYFAPAFLFRCNLPFFQTLKHPRAANLNFPGGGTGMLSPIWIRSAWSRPQDPGSQRIPGRAALLEARGSRLLAGMLHRGTGKSQGGRGGDSSGCAERAFGGICAQHPSPSCSPSLAADREDLRTSKILLFLIF